MPDPPPPSRALATHTYLTSTRSLCAVCAEPVDAKILVRQGLVWLRRRCATHGAQEVCAGSSAQWFVDMLAHSSPIDLPSAPRPVVGGCPADCGPCAAHLGAFRLVSVEPPARPLDAWASPDASITDDVVWWVGPQRPPFASEGLDRATTTGTSLAADPSSDDPSEEEPRSDDAHSNEPGTTPSAAWQALISIDDMDGRIDTLTAARCVVMLDARAGIQSFEDDVGRLLRFVDAGHALDGLLVRFSGAEVTARGDDDTAPRGAGRADLVASMAQRLGPILKVVEAMSTIDIIELRLEPPTGVLLPLDIPLALDALSAATAGRLAPADFAPSPGAHAMCFAQAEVEREPAGLTTIGPEASPSQTGCLLVLHAWMAPDKMDLARLMRCPHGTLHDGVRVAPQCLPHAALPAAPAHRGTATTPSAPSPQEPSS